MTDDAIELFESDYELLELVEAGPQGPPGQVDLSDLIERVDVAVQDYFVLHPQSFEYDQVTAVYHWEIVHPLDHLPAVVVTDSAGSEDRVQTPIVFSYLASE